MKKCEMCNTQENFPDDPESELRPYGPGGSMICFRCAFATPESEERTKQNFISIVEASIAATGVFIIGEDSNNA
jgi:hypothetical protein